MSNESQYPSQAHRDDTASHEDATRALISFLTGESFDRHTMTEAVHTLTQQAPDVLVGLHQAILRASHGAEDIESACEDIAECLPGYVALGDQASARMPDVHRHLQSCVHCADQLTLLQEAEAHRAGWIDLSQRLREVASPALLILIGQRWQWFSDKVRPLITLSDEDVARGKQIGAWLLGQPPEVGFRFPDDTMPPLSLSTNFPNDEAHITLHVIPEHQAAEHRTIWRLRLVVERTSLKGVHVSLGNAERSITGSRTLRVGRPVEFQVSPPIDNSYWLSFEWVSLQDEQQQYKVELRLRSGQLGGDA